MDDSVDVLEASRRELDLSINELWWLYFALGGMRTEWEIDAILNGALRPAPEDGDLLALALNERFSELGRGHPIPYSSDAPHD
jgi:hypothetical protein